MSELGKETADNIKRREDILKRVIENIIIPRYPEVTGVGYISGFVSGVILYQIYIKTNDITAERASAMEDEIKSLFIMCGLNTLRPHGYDYVVVFIS